jgi:hypothetical protein
VALAIVGPLGDYVAVERSEMRKRVKITRSKVAVALSVVLMLALATSAQATTTTVGANFTTSAGATKGMCSGAGGCGSIIVGATAPAIGTASPYDGYVTEWRVVGADATPGYGINVVRKEADGSYTVTAAGPTVTPAGQIIESFLTKLPIRAGEYVELNIAHGASIEVFEAPSTEAYFSSTLQPGTTRLPDGEAALPVTFGYNADIESLPPALAPPASPAAPSAPSPGPPAPTAEAHCVVPKLSGRKLKGAKKIVRAADCRVGLVSTKKGVRSVAGKVIRQSPPAGSVLPAHTAVSVRLG